MKTQGKTLKAPDRQAQALAYRLLFSLFCLLSSDFCFLPAARGSEPVTIDQPQIERILAEYLKKHEAVLPAADIRFKDIGGFAAFTLPDGKLSTEVIPAEPSILDSGRFSIIFRVDGRVVKNITVRAKLEAFAPVAVARSELKRGMVIGPADISLIKLDLSGLRHPCLDESELLGKRLKRDVRQGQPLDRAAVEFPPLIKRGELVTVVVSRGALTVTARGVAKQDAVKDEPIRVLNSESQKEIIGRASGPGLVTMEL